MEAAPWLVPDQPSLMALAFEAADREGAASIQSWPEPARGGLVFGDLPPFLPWILREATGCHLLLFQARELGALVPGARIAPLAEGWLEGIDLEALARPLRLHPDLQPRPSVHVVRIEGRGRARVRSSGEKVPDSFLSVLQRLSGYPDWSWDNSDNVRHSG